MFESHYRGYSNPQARVIPFINEHSGQPECYYIHIKKDVEPKMSRDGFKMPNSFHSIGKGVSVVDLGNAKKAWLFNFDSICTILLTVYGCGGWPCFTNGGERAYHDTRESIIQYDYSAGILESTPLEQALEDGLIDQEEAKNLVDLMDRKVAMMDLTPWSYNFEGEDRALWMSLRDKLLAYSQEVA